MTKRLRICIGGPAIITYQPTFPHLATSVRRNSSSNTPYGLGWPPQHPYFSSDQENRTPKFGWLDCLCFVLYIYKSGQAATHMAPRCGHPRRISTFGTCIESTGCRNHSSDFPPSMLPIFGSLSIRKASTWSSSSKQAE
jgi:hypothetical protein